MFSPHKNNQIESFLCPYFEHKSQISEVCLKKYCGECRFSCNECLQNRHLSHQQHHLKIEDIQQGEDYFRIHDFSENPEINQILKEEISVEDFVDQISLMFDHFTTEINKNLHTLKKDIIRNYTQQVKQNQQRQTEIINKLQNHFSKSSVNQIISNLKQDLSNFDVIQQDLDKEMQKSDECKKAQNFMEIEKQSKQWLDEKNRFENFKIDMQDFLEHYNKELIIRGQNIDTRYYSNISKFYKTYQSYNNVQMVDKKIIFPKCNTGWATVYSEKFEREQKFNLKIKINSPSQQINRPGYIYFRIGIISYEDPKREGLNVSNCKTGNSFVLDSTNAKSKHPIKLKDGKQWGKAVFSKDETIWTIKGQISTNKVQVEDEDEICCFENNYEFEQKYPFWTIAISCFSAGSPQDFEITIL